MLFFQFQCICIYRDFSEPNKQHGFQSQPLQLTRGNIVISSTSSISKIFKTNSLCKTEGASSTQITLFRIFLIQPFNYAETKLVALKNIESQHPNFFLFLIFKKNSSPFNPVLLCVHSIIIQKSRKPYNINNIFWEKHEISKMGQKNSSISQQFGDHVKLIEETAQMLKNVATSMDSKQACECYYLCP